MTREFGSICEMLVSQIDSFRKRWFALSKQVLADDLAAIGMRIANEEFDPEVDIGMREQDTLDAFPFNRVSGDTIGGAIVAWQVQTAIGFALGRGYLGEAELCDFVPALIAASQTNEPWLTAAGVLVASQPITDHCICRVMAHYVMNDPSEGTAVGVVASRLARDGIGVLRGFTWLGTAVAWGGERTAREIMAKLKPRCKAGRRCRSNLLSGNLEGLSGGCAAAGEAGCARHPPPSARGRSIEVLPSRKAGPGRGRRRWITILIRVSPHHAQRPAARYPRGAAGLSGQ